MKHIFPLLVLLLLGIAGAQAALGIDHIQNTASVITDGIAFVQAHPIFGSAVGAWATHSEAAPFIKKWKHNGTFELVWKIGQGILGALAKKK